MRPFYKTKSFIINFLLACFLLSLTMIQACGEGSSPPSGIPAPVSRLMTISSPDEFGNIFIEGEAGAVLGGAKVTGTNRSRFVALHTHPLERLFLGVAYAETFYQNSTLANEDGSFLLALEAEAQDMIEIIQSIDNESSEPIFLEVPDEGIGRSSF